jgi:hypothetical protein
MKDPRGRVRRRGWRARLRQRWWGWRAEMRDAVLSVSLLLERRRVIVCERKCAWLQGEVGGEAGPWDTKIAVAGTATTVLTPTVSTASHSAASDSAEKTCCPCSFASDIHLGWPRMLFTRAPVWCRGRGWTTSPSHWRVAAPQPRGRVSLSTRIR